MGGDFRIQHWPYLLILTDYYILWLALIKFSNTSSILYLFNVYFPEQKNIFTAFLFGNSQKTSTLNVGNYSFLFFLFMVFLLYGNIRLCKIR